MAKRLPIFLAVLLLAAPPLAADPFEVLDALDSESMATVGKRLLREGTVLDVVRAIRRGRHPSEQLPAGRSEHTLKDGYGRETSLFVRRPTSEPGPAGYGVLVLLHGLGGNGKQLLGVFGDWADEHGFIVAAPSAQKPPTSGTDRYGRRVTPNEDEIGDRMLPHWWYYREDGFALRSLSFVKRRAPVDANRVILAGYSMGGFGTWNIGLRFPDRFAGLVPMAGGISRREYMLAKDEAYRVILENARSVPTFFIHGAQDTTVPVVFDRMSRDILEALGAPYVYREDPNGRHILPILGKNEKDAVKQEIQAWMAERVREAHPTEIDHRITGPYAARSYWVEGDVVAGSNARIVAKLREQEIDVETEGVKRLVLYFDDTLIDAGTTITVRLNGKRAWRGRPEPSVEAILRSWRDREDPHLTYAHMVILDVGGKTQRF